jgi:hypothetical protein
VELPLAAGLSSKLLTAYESRAAGWSKASGWSDALRAYGEADDGAGPMLTAAIRNGQNPDAANLPTVEFSVASPDVAEANVELAALDDPVTASQLLFFGVVGKSAIDAGDDYEFAWNGQLTAMPDGDGGLQPIYVSIWEDSAPESGSAALVLASFGLVETPDGASAMGALLFQDSDEETALLTLFDPPVTLPLADVARDLPGSTFTPLLIALDLTTEEQSFSPGKPIPLDSATIPITQGPASAGAYALVTTAYYVFGNAATDDQVADVVTPIEYGERSAAK